MTFTDRRILTTLVAAIFASPTFAQTHLVPEPSIYAPLMDFQPNYMKIELRVFAPAFDGSVRARAIVEPSFSSEFAVGIRQDAGAYSVFYYVAPEHLWDYAVLELMKKGEITSSQGGKSTTAEDITKLQASLPADPASIKLVRCETPIDPELANSIIGIWKYVLLQTRYDETTTLGVDGDTYHLSMEINHDSFAGQVWSPPENADVGRAVDLIYTIKNVCTKEHNVSLETLRSQVADLTKRFQIVLHPETTK